jgi:hypothetical protein
VPRSADVEERLHRQNTIGGNMTDPSLLPCQFKRLGELGALRWTMDFASRLLSKMPSRVGFSVAQNSSARASSFSTTAASFVH